MFPDDVSYYLVFFSTFEELTLPIKGPMEDAGVIKLYEPFPKPYLYVAMAENKRKDSGFPYGCADSAAADGRRGSNVYEVNPWLR